MDKKTLNAIYTNSEYHVLLDQTYIIKPNLINDKFERYLENNSIASWGIITAYNPESVIVSKTDNYRNHTKLKQELSAYTISEGSNPASSNWPTEKTCFIENISIEKVLILGKKYKQNAIIYGKLHQAPNVIWCT